MPAYHLARRSGPHRIAAIALFRALLSQCRRLAIPHPQHDELHNLIRNRFKQARFDQQGRRLEITFEAGYEAIDLLDAAVAGNEVSKSRILQLLEDAPLRARQPPPAPSVTPDKLRKSDMEAVEYEEATLQRPKQSLFDRPLPLCQLSGRRHVPILVSANRIPMLRIKKPQPQHLSGFLAHRIKTRQKRHDRRHRLALEMSIAEREDEWDQLVAGEGKAAGVENARTRGWMEPSWCDAIEDEIDEVHFRLEEERRKNREMAEKMQVVVDRETALFEKEKAERRQERARRSSESRDGLDGD